MNEPVDLSNCDREPIHIPECIQPFGFLIALTSDWMIARVSANIGEFCGRDAVDLPGAPVVGFFSDEAVHTLRNRLTLMRGGGMVERVFGIGVFGDERLFDVAIHMSGNQVVVECEPSTANDSLDLGSTVRLMMGRLDGVDGLEPFFREGARQVRALTGFDRVMVYRFDDTGAGEVVAEAVRSGLGSFLGLRYPSSDIPAQARELYVRNVFRIITDVDATPAPLIPADPGQPLDLSQSVLRAVSPIHIEYLKNMGVAASMSISIVVGGKLWGLFACHHYTPRRPSFERRSVAELFGQMFSMKLESRQHHALTEYETHARDVADRILAAVADDSSLLDDPAWLIDALGRTIPADGIGVWIDGRTALSGLTPPADAFAVIVRELNRQPPGRVHATDRIGSLVSGADDYAHAAAGMLAMPISRSPRDYVVLFRQEVLRTVRWAGEPTKAVEFGPNGSRLSPRKSFEAWSELVRGRSTPFNDAEIRVAETLRATLIEVVLRLSDEVHAERKRLGERQELLIAELNHRVRNILGLIRGLVRQSRSNDQSVESYVGELEGRIQALARAHDQITRDHWDPAPLRTLIETEAAAYLAARQDRVRTSGPDVLIDPQAFSTLALVIHELVTNSSKYGGLSDSGKVAVDWSLNHGGDLEIRWRESGGPAVQAPTRRGFGTTIISRSVPHDLGGTAAIRFALTGVEADFTIPAAHVTLRTEPARGGGVALPVRLGDVTPPSTIAVGGDRPLHGARVLLVEDSLIIALDAEDLLNELGAGTVIQAPNAATAAAEIAAERPDLAVLDVNLGSGTSLPVADELAALGVPYVFATGYGEDADLPALHNERPVIRKPYGRAELAAVLAPLWTGGPAGAVEPPSAG